jgi:hypothetical protein
MWEIEAELEDLLASMRAYAEAEAARRHDPRPRVAPVSSSSPAAEEASP